jgi:uncharacterized protein
METTTTTTQNNVQVIQQTFNDFLQGNIAGIIDACTEDVQWGIYKVPNSPFSGVLRGKEGVQEFFSAITQTLNYSSFEPIEFIAQGDNVIVLGHHTATVKNTGKQFDHDFCMHFKLQNSKIVRYFGFVDSYDEFKAYQA